MRYSLYAALSLSIVAPSGARAALDPVSIDDIVHSIYDGETPNSVAESRALEVRRERCDAEAGRFLARLEVSPCVDDKATFTVIDEQTDDGWEETCGPGGGDVYEHQCVHEDADGHLYFNDGPSAPALPQVLSTVLGDAVSNWRWNQAFWPAGVNHDYCYHHNPITYGKDRDTCDREFYEDMKAICAVQETGEERDGCRSNAALSFLAVRVAGRRFYDAMDIAANYPPYVPQWQVLGLSGPSVDEKLDSLVADYEAVAKRLNLL